MTYLKFLNLNPVYHDQISLHDNRENFILEIKKNNYCTVNSVTMIQDETNHSPTEFLEKGSAILVSLNQGMAINQINMFVEYECELMWLRRSGNIMFASALENG